MSEAAAVNIAIKGTADVASIHRATGALNSLQEGAAKAGDTWEHLGKKLARSFSGADFIREVLGGFGIGSGFAVIEMGIRKIEAMHEETLKKVQEIEAGWREISKLQIEISQIGETKAQKQARLEKNYRDALAEQTTMEAKRDAARKKAEENLSMFQARTPEKRKENIDHNADVLDAEKLFEDHTNAAKQAEKQLKEFRDEQSKDSAEQTKNEIKDADGRAKAQQDEADKIEEAHKRIVTALNTSAEKYRQLADPQRKYKEQLAEIDLAARTFVEAGKPLLTQQEAAAAKARILAEMNDTAGKAIRATREEVEAYDIALEVLDKNPQLSDLEKQRQRIELINQQTAAIKAAKQALSEFMAANPGVDVGALTEALNRFGQQSARNAGLSQPAQTLGQRDDNAVKDLNDPAKHYQSAGGAAAGGAKNFLSEIGTASDNVAESVTGGLNAALQGTSDILYGLVSGSMTFKQAWQHSIGAIGQQFARMATDMVAKMIWRNTVERALTLLGVGTHVAGEGAKTAATAAGTGTRLLMVIKEALAAVYHGAVAAFSALAAIPIVGPILGAAALAGALALGIGLVSKIGHADGAIIRGPGGPRDDRIPAMVSNGEAITRASSVARFGEPFFNALNAGVLDLSALPDSIARQLPAAAAGAAQRSGGGAAAGPGGPAPGGGNIHLAFHNTEADAVQSLKGREGRRFLVDLIGKTVRDMS